MLLREDGIHFKGLNDTAVLENMRCWTGAQCRAEGRQQPCAQPPAAFSTALLSWVAAHCPCGFEPTAAGGGDKRELNKWDLEGGQQDGEGSGGHRV